MNEFLIQVENKKLYILNKTYTIKGVKYEKLTDEKMRAKFYSRESTAQKKADVLNESGLYEDKFIVEPVSAKIVVD